MLELILGGARSGKSRLAQQRAEASALRLHYIATAQALDDEMQQRIQQHQQQRDQRWTNIEEPLQLASILQLYADPQHCLLVDCLSLWLSNCLLGECWSQQKTQLFEVLPGLAGHIIFVSNETGMGVVPMGQLSREFVDESGFLHQHLAQLCDKVTLTVAGIPLSIKPQ